MSKFTKISAAVAITVMSTAAVASPALAAGDHSKSSKSSAKAAKVSAAQAKALAKAVAKAKAAKAKAAAAAARKTFHFTSVGTVSAVDATAGTITVVGRAGNKELRKTFTAPLSATADVKRNDVRATLADVVVGDVVAVHVTRKGLTGALNVVRVRAYSAVVATPAPTTPAPTTPAPVEPTTPAPTTPAPVEPTPTTPAPSESPSTDTPAPTPTS